MSNNDDLSGTPLEFPEIDEFSGGSGVKPNDYGDGCLLCAWTGGCAYGGSCAYNSSP